MFLELLNQSIVFFNPFLKPVFPEYSGFQSNNFLAFLLSAFNLKTSPAFGLTLALSDIILTNLANPSGP